MTDDPARCPQCEKPRAFCVCDKIQKLDTRTRVVILQHPQEQDRDLGTARLLTLSLPKAEVIVGLSWASLAAALGVESLELSRWAIVYPNSLKKELVPELLLREHVVLDRHGDVRGMGERLEGIVVLDGSWSQAKTLWWRNAWMLKHPRIVLHPKDPSIYGRLRREPKRHALSTLESVAAALIANGEPATHRDTLRKLFRTMVQRARDAKVAERDAEPAEAGEGETGPEGDTKPSPDGR